MSKMSIEKNASSLSQNGVKEAIRLAIKANTPIFITGSGGIGKSSIVKQVANELQLEVIDFRLSQVLVYDLLGYPKDRDNRMEYLPIANIPLENDPLPEGKKGFLLFLDEFNHADEATQGAAFRLILDRQIGKYNIHPTIRIVCAGNRIQDVAGVNDLISPMKTRLTHIEMQVNNKEFLRYIENHLENNTGVWDENVYAFLHFKPECINNFNPQEDEITYSTPRTLEMLSKQIKAGLLEIDNVDTRNVIIQGVIGQKAGIDFISFLEACRYIPKIEDIIKDPHNTPVPKDVGAKWALGVYLADQITKENAEAIITYCQRVEEKHLQTVIMRILVNKNKFLSTNDRVQKILLGIQNEIANINVGKTMMLN